MSKIRTSRALLNESLTLFSLFGGDGTENEYEGVEINEEKTVGIIRDPNANFAKVLIQQSGLDSGSPFLKYDTFPISGGWAPYFILEKFCKGGQHCGSIDIDFVLNPCLIDLKVYQTIVSLIGKRVYKPYVTDDGEVLPYRFYRSVKSPFDGVEYKIEVDFISEPASPLRQLSLIASFTDWKFGKCELFERLDLRNLMLQQW